MFQAPTNLPATSADVVAELRAQISTLKYRADRVMETHIIGPRGQLLTVTEAKERAEKLREAIENEEANGSHRHRRVGLTAKLLVFGVVVVVDYPIMLWLASSVFNVDWSGLS